MLLFVYSQFLDSEIERLAALEAAQEQAQLQLEYEANRAALMAKDYLPSPPYKGAIEGYLAGILLGGVVLGYEIVTVDHTEAVSINPPDKAKKAILVVEADPTISNPRKAIRYQTGEAAAPTATDGFPVSDEGVFEVGTLWNLKRLKMIGIEAGKTHTVQIEYQG